MGVILAALATQAGANPPEVYARHESGLKPAQLGHAMDAGGLAEWDADTLTRLVSAEQSVTGRLDAKAHGALVWTTNADIVSAAASQIFYDVLAQIMLKAANRGATIYLEQAKIYREMAREQLKTAIEMIDSLLAQQGTEEVSQVQHSMSVRVQRDW